MTPLDHLQCLLVERVHIDLGDPVFLPGERLRVLQQGVLPQDHREPGTPDTGVTPDTVGCSHHPPGEQASDLCSC